MSRAPSYHYVHAQLRRERGVARDHVCACGQPAEHWGYDRQDPNEIRADVYGRTLTYSADLAHYAPMCQPCHWALDHPVKTHCTHGHALVGDNVYVRPNGGRLCRTCKRDSLRRWREANPGWRKTA